MLLVSEFFLIGGLTILSWFGVGWLVPDEPELRVMGTLCGPLKTIALGVPLIGSIFGGSPNEAFYYLPIVMWHPLQLLIGSMLKSRLASFATAERERLSSATSTESRGLVDKSVVSSLGHAYGSIGQSPIDCESGA